MRTVAVTLATGLFSALVFPAGAQSVKLTIWNLGNLHYETASELRVDHSLYLAPMRTTMF